METMQSSQEACGNPYTGPAQHRLCFTHWPELIHELENVECVLSSKVMATPSAWASGDNKRKNSVGGGGGGYWFGLVHGHSATALEYMLVKCWSWIDQRFHIKWRGKCDRYVSLDGKCFRINVAQGIAMSDERENVFTYVDKTISPQYISIKCALCAATSMIVTINAFSVTTNSFNSISHQRVQRHGWKLLPMCFLWWQMLSH